MGLLLAAEMGLPRAAAGGTAWLPGNYPNPIKYPEACGRGDSVGWVCDPDNVLARDQADGVAALLQDISAATPPYPAAECVDQGYDGYPVAVALVKKLGTRFGRPMNVEAAYFADSLYNAWEMEYKECRNGILLVISTIDREAHLRIGADLESVLTKPKLNYLGQRAKKMVASGDLLGAVRLTLHEVAIQLVGHREPVREYSPKRAWGMSLFFCASAGILLMLVYRFWLWLGMRRLRRSN